MNTTAAPSAPSAVRVTGTVHTSRKYSDTRGNAVHELQLTQGPLSLPVLVRRSFGASPAAHIVAVRLEHQYRPRSVATVTGRALQLDARRGLLVLLEPDHLEHCETAALDPA